MFEKQTLVGALRYFALVFAAGFLFALVRVPLLVPRFGVRLAELVEMPLMLLVMVLSARFVLIRSGLLSRAARLRLGLLALLFLAVTELLLAGLLQGQSPAQYVASRDPVSGTVYALMLLLFAALPAVMDHTRRDTSR